MSAFLIWHAQVSDPAWVRQQLEKVFPDFLRLPPSTWIVSARNRTLDWVRTEVATVLSCDLPPGLEVVPHFFISYIAPGHDGWLPKQCWKDLAQWVTQQEEDRKLILKAEYLSGQADERKRLNSEITDLKEQIKALRAPRLSPKTNYRGSQETIHFPKLPRSEQHRLTTDDVYRRHNGEDRPVEILAESQEQVDEVRQILSADPVSLQL